VKHQLGAFQLQLCHVTLLVSGGCSV
jgi:hypothetical protein